MLASDSMIAVLTTNTFVQVKVFSYLFFLDYLLMNTADHKLIKEEFFYYCLDKGQLISKGLLGILNSPKKQTKKFDFTTIIPQVDLFSFVFWEKLKTPKRHFEIN